MDFSGSRMAKSFFTALEIQVCARYDMATHLAKITAPPQ